MKLWDYKYVKYLIRNYKLRGFQIRFPGGTSQDGKINSLVIAIEFNPTRNVFFVVVPYDPGSNLVNKLTNIKEDEKLLALRKLREETGLVALPSDLQLIAKLDVNNNILKDGSKHTKFFFLLEKFSGKLLDLENSSLLNRETATPFLVPGVLLSQTIFHRHLSALKYAINYIKSKLDEKEFNLIILAIKKRESKN